MIKRYSRKAISEVFSEQNKYKNWFLVEISVLRAMEELSIIPKGVSEIVSSKVIIDNNFVERVNFYEKTYNHDVLSFISTVNEKIGEYSKYFHMGLTSSDVVDTALAITLKQAIDIIEKDLLELLNVLKEKAFKYKDTLMMGRTHGVHAEPITFGIKLASWYDEIKRAKDRLLFAKENVLIGKISGAVGTFSNIDPKVEELALNYLGLKPEKASSQIVHRDRHAFLMSVLAIIASSLDKFATEIRHYQKTEVLELQEPFKEGQRGSSAMPHKKNPIHSERICGLSRVIRANALVSFENINLWHERDISHSSAERVVIPDSFIALDYILNLFIDIMKDIVVNEQKMLKNMDISKGLYFSSKILVLLMQKGMERDKAYDLVQKASFKAWNSDISFKEALLEEKEISSLVSKDEIDSIMNPYEFLKNRDYIFKRVFE